MYKYLIIILLYSFLCSCSKEENFPATSLDLTLDWAYATAAEVNIGDLSHVLEIAENIPRLTSLIFVRDGKLVEERYLHGFNKGKVHDVRSVTKSILSVLTGIAIEKGLIKNINDSIEKYLPPHKYTLHEQHKKITIKHLLTMSPGFEYNEVSGSSYTDWRLSEDPIQFLLDLPFEANPGEKFNYNSAAIHLLGVIIEEVSGMNLEAFSQTYLFDKLNIQDVKWEPIDHEFVNGGSGIDLSPLDIAKIGQLYLQNGKSGHSSIINHKWVNESTQPYYEWRISHGALHDLSYGYLWWTLPEMYFAWGWGGQFLFVAPKLKLVIVTTVQWQLLSTEGGKQITELPVLELIINHILPIIYE